MHLVELAPGAVADLPFAPAGGLEGEEAVLGALHQTIIWSTERAVTVKKKRDSHYPKSWRRRN